MNSAFILVIFVIFVIFVIYKIIKYTYTYYQHIISNIDDYAGSVSDGEYYRYHNTIDLEYFK